MFWELENGGFSKAWMESWCGVAEHYLMVVGCIDSGICSRRYLHYEKIASLWGLSSKSVLCVSFCGFASGCVVMVLGWGCLW